MEFSYVVCDVNSTVVRDNMKENMFSMYEFQEKYLGSPSLRLILLVQKVNLHIYRIKALKRKVRILALKIFLDI